MKIWFISDTHGVHNQLSVPKVDCLIFAGDSTNYRGLAKNELEFYSFKNWLFNLDIPTKILIAGNHDTHLLKKYNIDDLKYNGVIYLEHEYYSLDNKLMFGSPYTPTFYDWNFMVPRDQIYKYWEALTEGIDILITHGPPRGILDLSRNMSNRLEFCGDEALLKAVLRVSPKIHIFGHIHNNEDCINQGIREYEGIKFMNVSCVTDGKLEKISSNGIILEI